MFVGDVKFYLQLLSSDKTKKQQTSMTTVFVNCCDIYSKNIWLYIKDLLPAIINSVIYQPKACDTQINTCLPMPTCLRNGKCYAWIAQKQNPASQLSTILWTEMGAVLLLEEKIAAWAKQKPTPNCLIRPAHSYSAFCNQIHLKILKV